MHLQHITVKIGCCDDQVERQTRTVTGLRRSANSDEFIPRDKRAKGKGDTVTDGPSVQRMKEVGLLLHGNLAKQHCANAIFAMHLFYVAAII